MDNKIDVEKLPADSREWTEEEYRAFLADVQEEFPPAAEFKPQGMGVGFHQARLAAGMSRYAVAKAAGIPDPRTVKQIEAGHDVKLSSLEAVAKVLGLKLQVVAALALATTVHSDCLSPRYSAQGHWDRFGTVELSPRHSSQARKGQEKDVWYNEGRASQPDTQLRAISEKCHFFDFRRSGLLPRTYACYHLSKSGPSLLAMHSFTELRP